MSVFSKAKTIAVPTKTKKKKDTAERVHIAGLASLAIVDTVVKTFTAIQKTLAETVKDEMAEYFVKVGNTNKKRPENFRGVDDENDAVEASCEFRQRSSRSVLTEDEISLLERHAIPFGEDVITEECYVINPAYASNTELLDRVSVAIMKVKGLPEDFILHQPKVANKIVTEESIDAVFNRGISEQFIGIVSSLAVRPTFEGTIKEAMDFAQTLIDDK